MNHQGRTEPFVLPSTPSNGPIDAATLELLESWRREDASPTAEEVAEAEEDLRKFKRAMDESRITAGEPLLFT